MKYTVTVFALLLLFGTCSRLKAQTSVGPDAGYVYCELVGTQKMFTTRLAVSLSVDFGEEQSGSPDTLKREELKQKVPSFQTMVDAMHYMGGHGWEFVQAYVVTINERNFIRWILRKRVG